MRRKGENQILIEIYYKTAGSDSFKKVCDWLNNRAIPYKVKRMSEITRPTLMKMLALSTDGFEEILVSRTQESKKRIKLLDEVPVSAVIEYCMRDSRLLREPITVDDNRLLVGFNSDEIRMFVQHDYRRVELQALANSEEG
jgi:regulatory protein spx